ncbi:MAG: hypothetical protein PUD16_05455, partial [bacterium]|nr:hypothetical protein [bacterium]
FRIPYTVLALNGFAYIHFKANNEGWVAFRLPSLVVFLGGVFCNAPFSIQSSLKDVQKMCQSCLKVVSILIQSCLEDDWK